MTTGQREVVKIAQEAFNAALDAGVNQESLVNAIFDASKEHELCIDATFMANQLFEADSRWLTRMAKEELRQREKGEELNLQTISKV